MTSLQANAALIIIDVQQAFNDPKLGQRNNPQAEANIAALLAAWRESGRPLFHIQHRSAIPASVFHPDREDFAVKPEAMPLPGEPVIFKDMNSAFICTDLEQPLRAAGIRDVVMVGITTDHCVSTSNAHGRQLWLHHLDRVGRDRNLRTHRPGWQALQRGTDARHGAGQPERGICCGDEDRASAGGAGVSGEANGNRQHWRKIV
jgi:hypothetical protein